MSHQLKAEDLLPLLARLSPEERLRLIRLAHLAPTAAEDGAAYAAVPVRPEEFAMDEDALEWDSEGWESLS